MYTPYAFRVVREGKEEEEEKEEEEKEKEEEEEIRERTKSKFSCSIFSTVRSNGTLGLYFT